MRDLVELSGMVLNQTPVGEYDRRVVILSKERGKITAFARGARRPNSRFLAATNPFSFGVFRLYEGREAYTLSEVSVQNYFEQMRTNYDACLYGMYFVEVMDYYTRENNDECEMLKLLYQSLRALLSDKLENRLVKCVFEIKTLVLQGEFPGVPEGDRLQQSTRYAIQYVESVAVQKLYSFTVTEEVLTELEKVCDTYRSRYMEHHFHSLDMLSQ